MLLGYLTGEITSLDIFNSELIQYEMWKKCQHVIIIHRHYMLMDFVEMFFIYCDIFYYKNCLHFLEYFF